MPKFAEKKDVVHSRATWNLGLGTGFKYDRYKNTPYMECEYSHAMGNSLGNFADYWDIWKKHDIFAGGFIWDFADQTIKFNNNGVTEWRYGGDFGDMPNDGIFSCNGIFRGDREPQPSAYEVRKVYQKIDFVAAQGRFLVKNLYNFTDLSKFKFTAELIKNGETETVTEFAVVCAPLTEVEIDLPFDVVKKETEAEYSVVLSAFDGAGERVAYEQIPLKTNPTALNESLLPTVESRDGEQPSRAAIEDTANEIVIETGIFTFVLDKTRGAIVSVAKDDKELLNEPLLPNFDRAIIDNDTLKQVDAKIAKLVMGIDYWNFIKLEAGLKPKKITATPAGSGAEIRIVWSAPHLSSLETVYGFADNGVVSLKMEVTPKINLVRYGFTFGLRSEDKAIKFYAKGGFENHCDRNTAAILRVYEGVAEDFIYDYSRPQENGNHTEARYLTVGKENPVTIINTASPFEFSVHPYTRKMLNKANHIHELGRLNHLVVNIDGKQRGVGGDIPASADLKEPYKILKGNDYVFEVKLVF
jgi:beta-galactosidase